MLHKSHISNIKIYSDEWRLFRAGKFTSSKIVELMAEKELSKGALTYIDQKVGEYIAGQPGEDENEIIEDEYTVWGGLYEPEALKVFANRMKIKYLVVQKLIHEPGSRFSSTPDGIHIINSSLIKEDCYNVATVEVKCPKKYPRFLELYRCKTPLDLKKVEKKYFCQVIDQMDNCHASVGYFACYHPLFPAEKNMNIIEFKKIDLWEDFAKLQQRKASALEKFNEILAEFAIKSA